MGSGSSDSDKPLKQLASAALAPFASSAGAIGLAVSGGSDSVAMLHLMAEAALESGVRLQVATVDHRLRPEAAAEAADVGRICQKLGLSHDVLVWEHGPVIGNLMQAAREARYQLLADWARRKGHMAVLLAHTADDQAETFLMGLSRASGLDGLTGMRPQFNHDGIAFHRPFLTVSRKELRAFLQRRGMGWIDDPSNDDPRFTRVKARKALKTLEPLGITVEGLSSVVSNLAMAQRVVREATVRAATVAITETAGSLSFDQSEFFQNDPEICRRLLIAMVRWIDGGAHPQREGKIASLLEAIADRRAATLAGVRFAWKGGRCTVVREARALGPPVALGQVWDNRWIVSGPDQGIVRAVGVEGLAQVAEWRSFGLSRSVALATPGVWDGDRLISAPYLQLGARYDATMTSSFVSFLLSH